MKKMFAMLMLLMLALCCAGAMAEGKVIPGSQLHSNQDASGEGWTWDSSRDELTITKSGLTVKAWKTTNGRIYVQDSCKELTLDQVDIDISDNIPLRINKYADSLVLRLKDSKLQGSRIGIYYFADIKNKFNLTVYGKNAIISGDCGISVANNEFKSPSLTLGGSVEIIGSEEALSVEMNAYNPSRLSPIYADGENYPGLQVYAGDDKAGAQLIGTYNKKSDNLNSKQLTDPLGKKKYVRLDWKEPTGGNAAAVSADLPQTGDSSSLALWLCLLAFAGVMGMKRREA